MSRKNIIAAIVISVLLGAGWLAWNVFFKPHRSVEDSPVTRVRADSLFLAFQSDESAANARFLDKGLEVSGEIAELNTNQQGQMVVILDTGDPLGGVVCTLVKATSGLTKGQRVRVRGFCSGYLTDVILRDAIIVYP